ncbi:MAG TPA: aryl-sulfate sulfotransferase [Verrucomicrobiae bacterium]|nr:aryl-sulfate sulfotransferase [Verrucomicrobiae bacterium]
MRLIVAFSAMALAFALSPCSRGATFLSGLSFIPATNAPLAGLLSLTTPVDTRISVLVSDGTDVWERDFYDYATAHSVPLLGFKPDRTNQILVTAYDKNRNAYTAAQPLTFVTAPLPTNFPTSVVLKSEPSQMEPGYTLFLVRGGNGPPGYYTIIDNSGEVVWYSPAPNPTAQLDVRQLNNGDLFTEFEPPTNCFLEMNMLGETVHTLSPPAAYPINPHDGIPTDHGTILYLSDVSRMVSNFPSSDTISNAPLVKTNIDDNPAVEISATNGALVNVWSPLDLLGPTRVTYLTYEFKNGYGVDNEHANAILEDTNDNSIIVSLRDQNAVFDFSRSGQLKWILGPPAGWSTNFQPYLLTPVGTPFEWNYGQHAPELTPQGTLLVYDDGNDRASPFDPPVPDQTNYSRGVEFSINETNMQVSQVWDSSLADEDRLFTTVVGKTQWLPQTRDILVTYGYVTYVNGAHPSAYSPGATMVRIIEYTHDPVPQVVFDLSFFDYTNTSATYAGYLIYRAERVPDLYPHPVEPVADLTINDDSGIPLMEFSADPTHSYLIQASTDLVNWTAIGAPVQEGGVGDYDFEDLNADQYTTRFYRVVTQ